MKGCVQPVKLNPRLKPAERVVHAQGSEHVPTPVVGAHGKNGVNAQVKGYALQGALTPTPAVTVAQDREPAPTPVSGARGVLAVMKVYVPQDQTQFKHAATAAPRWPPAPIAVSGAHGAVAPPRASAHLLGQKQKIRHVETAVVRVESAHVAIHAVGVNGAPGAFASQTQSARLDLWT